VKTLYYPASKEGWIVTLILLLLAVKIFLFIDARSHSVLDTLTGFAPWVITLMAVFDLLCFRRGEYPSWWRKNLPSEIPPQTGLQSRISQGE